MTSILKYAVLVLSVTLTATLHAKSINDSSQVQKLSNKQIECLVLNAYFESRNQGVKGMQAVTWVVLNRTKHPSYPSTPCAVIVLSVTLTATLQAKSINDSSQVQKLSKSQIECLSINAYMESRGQGVKGMQAVTWVVLNRTKHPSYPSTPCAVIAQPKQFSWYGNKTPQVKEKDAYTQAESLVEGVPVLI